MEIGSITGKWPFYSTLLHFASIGTNLICELIYSLYLYYTLYCTLFLSLPRVHIEELNFENCREREGYRKDRQRIIFDEAVSENSRRWLFLNKTFEKCVIGVSEVVCFFKARDNWTYINIPWWQKGLVIKLIQPKAKLRSFL